MPSTYYSINLEARLIAMKRLLLLLVAAFCSFGAVAQLLTWTPAFPTDTDNITITVDATKGNQGLLGYNGNVYVHVGAITNLSTGPSNWLHVPFTWGSTEAAALAVPGSTYKWAYTINNPRVFFNLAAGEQLKAIAILFRAGGCTTCQAQRNADGSDMYVPIYDNSLAVRITEPFREPKYQPVPEPVNKTVGESINIAAVSSSTSTLKLFLNGSLIQTSAASTSINATPTLTTAGNNIIIAEADNGSAVKRDTLQFFVSPAVAVAPLPAGVREGINYAAGNTAVTLVLKAPSKTRVGVIGEFPGSNWTEQPQYMMNKTPDGIYWWLQITGLTPGTEYAYQYMVDGNLKIADPYAEKILDPYIGENNQSHDQNIPAATYPNLRSYPAGQTGIVSLLQTAAPAYNWSSTNFNRPDKRGLVIYELLVRDFVAAHDWKTIRDSLNYLKKLGVNAIQIMPFNEFEGNNSWGYNPDFYFAPDKFYGPKNTLKEFIDSCHKKGIAVIMDIALNHSFGLSPMVQLYWDAANNRPASNNPWFNPTPRHAFNVGYDMNHESLDTRYFVSRVVEHWLQEYKIDGFRFDLSKGFTQTNTCPGGNCDVNQWSLYDASRVAIWKKYYDTVQSKSNNAYVILEHFAENSEEQALSDYGMLLWGKMNYNYGQAAMGHTNEWDFSNGIHSVRNWTKPHLVTYMESHDEERLMYMNLNFGNSSGQHNTRDTTTALKRMEMDAAFFLTIPGPKMIWQFGELGYHYSINTCVNGTVNSNCRLDPKPIRWDFLQDSRRKNLYNVYSDLLQLRNHPLYKEAFLSGTINRNLSGPIKWISVNSGDTSRLFVIGNFSVSGQTGNITFPVGGAWFDYLNDVVYTATGNSEIIGLQPGEYRVYVNRNINNLSITPVINVPWDHQELEANAFPNPATSQFMLDLRLPKSNLVSIDLYNALGQHVNSLYKGFLVKGAHQLSLENKTKVKGHYYITIRTANTTKSLQVTFQ